MLKQVILNLVLKPKMFTSKDSYLPIYHITFSNNLEANIAKILR